MEILKKREVNISDKKFVSDAIRNLMILSTAFEEQADKKFVKKEINVTQREMCFGLANLAKAALSNAITLKNELDK